MKIKTYFKLLFCLLVLSLIFQPAWAKKGDDMELNTLELITPDKTYTFTKVVAVMRDINKEIKRIEIGLSDKDQKAELFFSVFCQIGMEERRQIVNTSAHDIQFIFKSMQGSLVILPPVQFPKSRNMQYVVKSQKATRNGQYSFTRKEADWARMSRAEKLASGKGIIRNRGMEQSSFSLTLKPVVENGKVTEISGSFSGVGAYTGEALFNRYKSDQKEVLQGNFNGKFRVEVHNEN